MLELLLTLFMLPKGWFSLSLLLVLHDHNVITHLKTFFFMFSLSFRKIQFIKVNFWQGIYILYIHVIYKFQVTTHPLTQCKMTSVNRTMLCTEWDLSVPIADIHIVKVFFLGKLLQKYLRNAENHFYICCGLCKTVLKPPYQRYVSGYHSSKWRPILCL